MAADSSAVKVCVRVRPLIAREESAASENAEPVQLFWKCDKKSIHQIDDGNSTKSFCFDRVFTAQETTSQLYQNIAKPLVVSTVEGYNGTIFAYGQTSSGKTFTMMGSDHIPGVIPLAVEDVFQTIKNCPKKEFLLRVSYMEIYNETVTDLLVDSWKRKPLEVRETLNKNIYVADLTEELVTSPAQALAWIRKGEKNRHYGKTKMNQRSSRSHTIFRMILESRERSDPVSGENADGAIIVSHLNLVDLAGSERASQTGAEGTRFKEGCNINRSLFTLGQVIKKLTDEGQKGFTNYRDSKLTRILQNSLGGNAKTVIICTITPVTLDETLSTLQFASTAKKMKNDPHVTEVSDDGALLKRYRNEIADLKRRLQEVSSVTHTTATEREVLSQLLQEKDQLQRDQEDRIRNLTKLLVTSNNLDPVKKMPKRRVTWGGKMLRLARSSVCDGDGSFMRKRKADRSYLSELGEEDEFDSQWEIPDEPSDEMEISPCSVTVRSFGDSPKDFVSQDRMHELSSKVSNLELQLEVEGQQKEDAVAKVEKLNSVVSELELQLEVKSREKDEANAKADILDARVLELELQLQTEVQQEPRAVEKILEGPKVAELELQLHTETQQKLEALEKVEMLGVRVADLERQLEQQSHTISEPDEQMRREFAETIQLCETLASEKDMVVAERDYLKQELGMFIEQTESLEQEKAVLSQELKEKREMDEFEGLEDEFRKEHEDELQNEISRLKKALEFSELQCQELQNKVDAVSEQLRSKTEFAEQLQSLSGKDLVQEVTKLRRSLDDAEGVSRDTKKEWAVLRSESIALEEMNVTLTANHKKMEAEVNSLRFQLESEKSRYRTMQSDLQKELNLAFEENTKLTTLLDGKVPKNLIDGVELERKVANLNKELAAAQQVERTLKDQLEELPEMVDTLKKQVCDLTEELGSAHNERDNLLTAQTQWLEEAQQLRDSLQTSREEILNIQACLNAAAQREEELSQQCADRGQQLDSLRSELELCAAERSRLTATVEEAASKLEEGEQHRASLEDKLKETEQLVKDLEEKLDDSESSRTTEEEISKELHEQVNQLSHELQSVRAENEALLCEKDTGLQAFAEMEKLLSTVTAERDQLNVQMAAETQRQKNLHPDDLQGIHKESDMLRLSQELQSLREEKDALLTTGAQGSADEIEKLLSAVASLSAERDQLKMDMQENVDMMIENQEELRTALEKNRELKEQIKQLEATHASKQDTSASELRAQLEELRTHLQTLTEELESVRTERDGLLSHSTDGTWSSSEEMDKVLCRVASLSEEKDQLQEILEGLRREKNQLKAELEDRMEMVVQAQRGFNQPEILTSEQQAHHERVTQLQQELTDAKCLISSLEEELQEQKQRNVDLERLCEQKECDSHQQTKTLTDELESTRAERDALLFEKETNTQSCTEQMEKLQCRVTSLSEERDQLQETLEGLRREKNQLRQELEEEMEMMQCELQQQLGPLTQSLKEEQEAQQLLQLQQLEEHLERSRAEVNQLKSDLQENVQLMSEELRVSQEKIRALQDELSMLRTTKAELESRLSCESDAASNLQTQELQMQVESLKEELESICAERDGVRATTQSCTEQMEKLQCRVTSLSEERDQLQETLEGLRREKNQLRQELEEEMEALQRQLTELNSSLQTVSGEKEQLERELQHNVDMTSTTQELLSSVQEELCRQKQMNSDLLRQSLETESSLGQQIQTLSEKLESSEAQRDHLLSSQSSTEEMERMLCSVASLSKEKEQLHDAVEELTQEKTQIKAELEDMMETLQSQMKNLIEKLGCVESERDDLLSEKQANTQTSTEEMQRMQCRVTSLSEERDQLQETVEELRREKMQIKAELENRIEALEAQMETLIEKLKSVEAERDGLLSERTSSSRTVAEEMERVQCRLASLGEERDQLQETLEGLTQERNQLRAEVAAIQQKLSEQEQLHLQQQTEKGQQEAELRQEVQQMQEQLQMCRHKQAEAEAHVSQQMLSETSPSKPSLREQLSRVDQCTATVKHSLSSRLQESTGQLEEFFGKFQHFIDMCSKYNHKSLNQALRVQFALKEHELTALPEPTMKAYGAVLQTLRSVQLQLADIIEFLQLRACVYRKQFEQLVKTDLAVFEEKRLQDLLLCRVQAPNYSVKDEDFHSMWEQRLTDLLDKRQLYLKEMGSILEKFSANMISFSTELSVELRERDRLKEQLQGGDSYSTMHSILSCELDHRSALAHSRKATLQGIMDEHNRVFEELKVLDAQAESQLMEERSKNSTLLKALEGAPLKTESSLLKDNQQLVLQLQQTEEKVKVLRVQNKQLEEAQVKASSRVSNHKQATQLLQTELQDSRAQVEEKENMIQSLKSKLRESEKKASPSGIELEKLSAKLFKLEVELSSASDKHQQEIQRMNTVLNQKEDSLRKLKEALRKAQQQGEESFLQGEDLHARLTNPRGLVVKSSILLEKTKLEDEVKQLTLKITELESLVSDQQAEINKWKNRAIKLKVKRKTEVDAPSSPCTPTKRGLPMSGDCANLLSSPKKFLVTPKKILDSPRKLLDSPKSRFFDVGEPSDLLSRNCPKQFFDNSCLGTIPDADAASDKNGQWWPLSPKQEDMCKTQ